MYSPFYGDFTFSEVGTPTDNINILTLENRGNAVAMTNTQTSLSFNQYYYDAVTPAAVESGRVTVSTEGNWTSVAATQDSFMAFQTTLNGVVGTKMRLSSAGNLTLDDSGVAGNYKLSFGEDANSALALFEVVASGNFFYGLSVLTPAANNEGLAIFGGTGNNAPSINNCQIFVKRTDGAGTNLSFIGS